MNKNILIVLQTKNDIIENIKNNLIHNTYNPYFYPSSILEPYQPSFISKCVNLAIHLIYPKFNFLKYKRNKYEKKYQVEQLNFINNLQDNFFDYTLVFRADLLNDDFILLLKQKSKKIIAYQWDGMNRYENIFSKIDFFDSFYCFDPNDKNEKIKFISNFYFDNLKFNTIENPNWDITYIGYFTKERFEFLEKLARYFSPHNYKLNFELKSFDDQEDILVQQSKSIKKIDIVYSYNKLLEIHNNSKIILDLKVDVHEGLSFRFFEAIQLNKKLVTTNTSVINYDFYNPNNIFILTENNIDELIHFFELPYIYPSDEIINKYAFSNWLKKLIN